MKIYLDLETYCDLDLKEVGVYRYVEHPSFEITLFAYSFEGRPAKVAEDFSTVAEKLREHLNNPKIIKIAHNVGFDRVALSAALTKNPFREGFLDPSQWRDTMAKAANAGYPQGLGPLADALGVAPKDAAGTQLINFFAKPYRGKRRYPQDDPERWQQFVDYAAQDVDTLVEVDKALPEISDKEQAIWELDQRINDRGITVDLPLARWAEEQNNTNTKKAKAELEALLGIENAGSVQQIRRGLADIGLELSNLRAETVEDLLDSGELTEQQQLALELRSNTSLSAAKKYTAVRLMTNDDSRFRGGFRYFGATTGRWAGRGLQIQNLPRLQMDYPAAAVADALMGNRAEPKTLKALIRSTLIGPFVVSDFSAIEARVLAWIAGEHWALEAFHSGRDIYVETAQRMGGLSRQQGKTAVLALGYAGGVGSLRVMGASGTDEELDEFKSTWRRANQNITQFWYDLENALEAGSGVIGPGLITVTSKGSDRYVHLPSGRSIAYRKLKRERYRKKTKNGFVEENGLRFQSPRGRTTVYGGLACENVCQGIARDLLAETLLTLDRKSYDIVGHVHDEVIVEDPQNRLSVETIEQIMATPPAWASGLPLGAEGFRTYRYKKG